MCCTIASLACLWHVNKIVDMIKYKGKRPKWEDKISSFFPSSNFLVRALCHCCLRGTGANLMLVWR